MRILCLDVGDERIGLALSDELGMVARPLEIVRRVAGPASFRRMVALCEKHGVERIVVGLPLLMDGSPGKQVQSTEAYVAGLRTHTDLPITYWDERLSSQKADAIIAQNRQRRKQPTHNDAVAAAVILQEYLDRQDPYSCPDASKAAC